MKTKVLTLLGVFMLVAIVLFASNKTEKIKVYGNCSMCEKRIEKAASGVDGVSKADWDKETKMLEVTFDDVKTDIKKVHKAVAAVGHDTDEVKAKDEVYNALHDCCKYERPKAEAKN